MVFFEKIKILKFYAAERAAKKFAPLVWLAPGERFFPSSTLDFLENTKPSQSFGVRGKLPVGAKSWHTYLEPRDSIGKLSLFYA